jgi:hypothetical protein
MVCVIVGGRFVMWSNWYGRYLYVRYRAADRFPLDRGIAVAKELGGSIVLG